MSFYRYNSDGTKFHKDGVVCDCSKDEPITEQQHVKEVDINRIVKKYGMDMIQKTNLLMSQDFQFDDVAGNDFQEAMFKVTQAQQHFDSLPAEIRKKFDNSPAQFLDFVQNPSNADQLVDMGLAVRQPEPVPIQVEVTNPTPTSSETPPA